jgi:hypothetical protein
LNGNIQNLWQRHPRLSDTLAQRHAVDVLRGDESDIIRLADLIDGEDVGMVQGRSRARLLLEPAHAVFPPRELRGKSL